MYRFNPANCTKYWSIRSLASLRNAQLTAEVGGTCTVGDGKVYRFGISTLLSSDLIDGYIVHLGRRGFVKVIA